MKALDPADFESIVFFTGAGMSAESGVPTYRGQGGIWHQYNWEEYACQEAFDRNPAAVVEFHQQRRRAVATCKPHSGHELITRLQKIHSHVSIITQNIDGLHQRSGSDSVLELHGSLWRVRCDYCGSSREDTQDTFLSERCECGRFYRPDIVWFGDCLDQHVIDCALLAVRDCDLFISIGTSGSVWPAAGLPAETQNGGAFCIEINLEETPQSTIFNKIIHGPAGDSLNKVFKSFYR